MAISFSDVLSNSKNIIAGIMVILSLVGAAYGTFKPETDARITYDTLAPEVDLLNERNEENVKVIHGLEARIIKLEAENRLLQSLLVAYLAREGIVASKPGEKGETKIKLPTIPVDKIAPMPPPKQESAPPLPQRKRAEPYWKKGK